MFFITWFFNLLIMSAPGESYSRNGSFTLKSDIYNFITITGSMPLKASGGYQPPHSQLCSIDKVYYIYLCL